MCLPVWTESKQSCFPKCHEKILRSTCAFPFGGNRNNNVSMVGQHIKHGLHVPSRLEGIETIDISGLILAAFSTVYMCLPVWREWKLGIYRSTVVSTTRSVYMCLPVWRESKRISIRTGCSAKLCLHVPSRLEGIETCCNPVDTSHITLCLHVPSRLEGIETIGHHAGDWDINKNVYMCLPVRRESKL